MNLEQEKQWLTDFIQVQLDDEILERIKNFSLLWSLFETFACNKNANMPNIANAVELVASYEPITNNITEPFLDYFSTRYFDLNGNETNHFNYLNFPNGNEKNNVIHVLTKIITDPKEVLKALLYIVYRYRNNLFHGEKNLAHLNGQIDNFIQANALLIEFLNLLKKHALVYPLI